MDIQAAAVVVAGPPGGPPVAPGAGGWELGEPHNALLRAGGSGPSGPGAKVEAEAKGRSKEFLGKA